MDQPTSPLRERRERVSEHVFVVLMAVACGIGGALAAIGLRAMVLFVEAVFFREHVPSLHAALTSSLPEPLAIGIDQPWWIRLLAPTVGLALVGPFLRFAAREAQGHGVPEVMEAVARRGGVIPPRIGLVKTLASALTIGSGGSVGREGPIVQIGAAIGSGIGQLLRLPTRQVRTLVAAGAAAGLAATFNAPITGAMFAAEVILLDFATARLTPIVIASVVATVLSRAVLGDHPSFAVPSWQLVSPWELVPYAALGFVSALVGVGFARFLEACEEGFEKLRAPTMAKGALGGLLVGLIGTQLPYVFGSSYGPINAALGGQLPLFLLAMLCVAKIVATSLTLSSGGSGGVFAPSLFIGAMLGGAFGHVVHSAFPAATAGSGPYALVAMGAVLAASSHAPITAIVLVFEVTQSITIIPPLMTACVIATLTALFLRRESIYTMPLLRRGLDVHAEKDPNVLRSLFVRDMVDREPELVPAGASFQDVLDLVVRSRHGEFFVVDDKDHLLGAISVAQLRRLLFEEEALRHVVVAADLIEPNRPTLSEADDLDSALHLFSQVGVVELAVVSAEDARRIVGSLHERDVVEAYHREMLRRDLAGGLGTRVGLAGRGHDVDLGGGYVLAEVDVPPAFAGRSLRELDLRARSGVQVLLVRGRAGGSDAVRVPAPDDRVQIGDVLVIAGPAAVVERIERGEWSGS
jgi:CIC family chloride channel protein